MDDTPKNILMCKKAKKIQQKRKKWAWGDIYCEVIIGWIKQDKKLPISIAAVPQRRFDNEIWLPTQTQLQKMLGDINDYGNYPLAKFCLWITTTGGIKKFYHHQYKLQFTSMEQLWLAFVMFELYQKMWNGKEWINP